MTLELKNEVLNQILTDLYYDLCTDYFHEISNLVDKYDEVLEGSEVDNTLSRSRSALEDYRTFLVLKVLRKWDPSLTIERTWKDIENFSRERDEELTVKLLEIKPSLPRLEEVDFTMTAYSSLELAKPCFYEEMKHCIENQQTDFTYLLYSNELQQWEDILQSSYPTSFNDWLRNMNLTSHSMIYTLNKKRAREYAQQYLRDELKSSAIDEIKHIFKEGESRNKAIEIIQVLSDKFLDSYEDQLFEFIDDIRKEA